MANGLNITVKEFQRLPVKEQNTILFENTEQLKKMVSTYIIQQRISYGWLATLSAVGTWMATRLFILK